MPEAAVAHTIFDPVPHLLAADALLGAAAASMPPAHGAMLTTIHLAVSHLTLSTRAATIAGATARLQTLAALLAEEDVSDWTRDVAAACHADLAALGRVVTAS